MLSPGIETREGNIGTTVVRSTNGTAALVGKFNWGPAYQVIQTTTETDFIDRFGTPDNYTADYVLSGVNFLKYGNDLRVVRVIKEESAKNASAIMNSIGMTITSPGTSYKVGDKFSVKRDTTTVESNCRVIEIGENGSITKAFIPSRQILQDKAMANLDDLTSYTVDFPTLDGQVGTGGAITTLQLETESKIFSANEDTAKDVLEATAFQTVTTKYKLPAVVAAYAGEFGDTLTVEIVSFHDYSDKTATIYTYPDSGFGVAPTAKNVLQYGPQTPDQYAMIVRSAGVVKESFVVSTNPQDRDMYGSKIFIDDFFANGNSRYISAVSKGWPVGFSGTMVLKGGLAKNNSTDSGSGAVELMKGWDMFADKETQRVGLLIAGAVAGEGDVISSQVQKHVSSVSEIRQDCVAFFSPSREHVVNQQASSAVDKMIEWRTGQKAEDGSAVENNMNIHSSYGFFDANYKFQYDKYNDVNRWVPFAADIAGLCARTDTVSYAWMSPAGYNRGQILDVIKVAVDTNQAHRDRLYQVELNPVISTPGDGVILYGDKTATGQPTAFNRINVRRLSNMIKFDISETSKYKLFQNNDAFERADFRMSTSQYMNNIRTLGGVYDFRVVCDESNNTPAIIDSNEFIGTVLFKPARSINFIILNINAVATGLNFDEIVG